MWTNPHSTLFLIGDDSNRYERVDHVLIADYLGSATEFARVYQHLSTNPIEYELFCFQRWFILKDFMARQGLEACFYLDSDVMVYDNLTPEHQRLQSYKIALTDDIPSTTAVNGLDALSEFCAFIFDLYQDQTSFQQIESAFKQQLQTASETSISDMFAFKKYREQNGQSVGELLDIVDDAVYDARMTASYGFKVVNGIKSIHFKDKQPFGEHLSSGKTIRFKSLHFQGNSKRNIKDYFMGDRLPERIASKLLGEINAASTQSRSTVAALHNAIQLHPDDPEAHYRLGCALLEAGQPADAAHSFQAAIQRLPTFLGAYINLGVAHLQQNQPEEAIRCYQAALELEPNSALAYGNLGYAYAEIGQLEASEDCTAMCNALETLALKPDWAESYRNLGLAYQRFGNLQAAIQHFDRAIALQPDFTAAHLDLETALLHQSYQPLIERLRTINLIIFPNWQEPLEHTYADLEAVFKAVLMHPQASQIALLIDANSGAVDAEFDIETALNEVMFNVLMAAIDLDEAPEIYPVHRLTVTQWDGLRPHITARIRLNYESMDAVPPSIQAQLSTLELDADGRLSL